MHLAGFAGFLFCLHFQGHDLGQGQGQFLIPFTQDHLTQGHAIPGSYVGRVAIYGALYIGVALSLARSMAARRSLRFVLVGRSGLLLCLLVLFVGSAVPMAQLFANTDNPMILRNFYLPMMPLAVISSSVPSSPESAAAFQKL